MPDQLLTSLEDFFTVHFVERKEGRLVLTGALKNSASYEDIQARLVPYRLQAHLYPSGGLTELRFVPMQTRQKINVKLPVILLSLTFLTTFWAGAIQQGSLNPFQPAVFGKALLFSVFLLGILGLHELGHFFFARRHGVDATLPFFIPAPTFIGTFGAIIRIRSAIPNRLALLQIGAAGPIFGFLVALFAAVVGLSLSHTVPALLAQQGSMLQLGDNLIFLFLERALHLSATGEEVVLHPIAFAAWIGFFVTALNLIPIGQFDGGHVLYALFPDRHLFISRLLRVLLIGMGFFWPGWWVWAAASYFFPVKHQRCLNELQPLTRREKWIGGAALILFLLCFTPIPFSMGHG